jgi:hypothetical protein
MIQQMLQLYSNVTDLSSEFWTFLILSFVWAVEGRGGVHVSKLLPVPPGNCSDKSIQMYTTNDYLYNSQLLLVKFHRNT